MKKHLKPQIAQIKNMNFLLICVISEICGCLLILLVCMLVDESIPYGEPDYLQIKMSDQFSM